MPYRNSKVCLQGTHKDVPGSKPTTKPGPGFLLFSNEQFNGTQICCSRIDFEPVYKSGFEF